MKIRKRSLVTATLAMLLGASPALAGWKLLPAQQAVDLKGMSVTPQSDWNRSSARPGRQGESWTHDGFGLNALEFFSAVPAGQPLYKERNRKRNPMPKFDSTMLLPDYADFFERSFRASNALSDFTILETRPAQFGGHSGLALRYRYSAPNDELVRFGIARLAIVKGKLFVANFYAPELHYYTAGLTEAEVMMDGARF